MQNLSYFTPREYAHARVYIYIMYSRALPHPRPEAFPLKGEEEMKRTNVWDNKNIVFNMDISFKKFGTDE